MTNKQTSEKDTASSVPKAVKGEKLTISEHKLKPSTNAGSVSSAIHRTTFVSGSVKSLCIDIDIESEQNRRNNLESNKAVTSPISSSSSHIENEA